MKSGYKVVWTEEANRNVDAIIEYLKNNWSEKEIFHFLIRLQDLFPASRLITNARRSVLSKQNTIYYRVEEQKNRNFTYI